MKGGIFKMINSMKKLIIICSVVLAILIIAGYITTANTSLPLHQSQNYYNYIQPSFGQYMDFTEKWLTSHRTFISNEHQKEIKMNMPFERIPERANKAILLVHGLGDSPFSFSDISLSLEQRGFHVQALLLPGHGSNPEDMHLTYYEDWQNIVDHYTKLLQQQYQDVWLGGFSTGANLVSIYLLNNSNVDGLLLFSPGFHSKTSILEKFTPLISLFWDGVSEVENNFAKYNTMPLHGLHQYARSAEIFRDKIAGEKITIPTLIVVSEADSIIDSYKIKKLFSTSFTHPNSKLIWYGENEEIIKTKQTSVYSMHRDDLKISTGSHMSLLFSPTNLYYGKAGEKMICENSLNSENIEHCEQGNVVWLSAWGHTEKNKVFARLTWNPYFSQLEDAISLVTTEK